MRLWAISDLHLANPANRAAISAISPHSEDWLALAGDLGESDAHLHFAFDCLNARFAQLVWIPGNHELWTSTDGPRGEARYRMLVDLARSHGVLTPEDPYPLWPGDGPPTVIAPLFVLYDYTFRPDELPADQVLAWAAEADILCADEILLPSDPYPTRTAWCQARVAQTAARLASRPPGTATVLINHYPLRRAHARRPRIPRFAPWCGTRLTEAWPERFAARAVVYGHLHVRRSFVEASIAFHEVSLGYPHQWDPAKPIDSYLVHIL
jgi:predicted phosphodiesterase